jgi:hypothetical protein
MKRLFEDFNTPNEGGIPRNIQQCVDDFQGVVSVTGSSSSSGQSITQAECCVDTVVAVYDPPGCSVCEPKPSFPTPGDEACLSELPTHTCTEFPFDDNNTGSLPFAFGVTVEIDPFGYDSEYGNVLGVEYEVSYVDLYTLLGDESSGTTEGRPSLQYKTWQADCFCSGEGITRTNLTINRPQFPPVVPLPFFWVPPFNSSGFGGVLKVREKNPDGPPLEATCCPQADEELPGITASIGEDGELQLQRREKPEIPKIYRSSDTDLQFLLCAGYPRWCCVENDCTKGNGGDFHDRWLHFPRWPRDKGNGKYDPYLFGQGDCTNEPLGLIPSVTDVQCDVEKGILYVYYMNFVFHDGILHDIEWATPPPRPGVTAPPPEQPPDHPEDLVINTNYQGSTVVSGFPNPIGPLCEDTCEDAAIAAGTFGCDPVCADDNIVCEAGEVGTEVTGQGNSEEAAIADALSNALIAIAADGNCDGVNPAIVFCWVKQIAPLVCEAKVKYCCPVA